MTQIHETEHSPTWWFGLLLTGMSIVVALAGVGLYTVIGWCISPGSLWHWMVCGLSAVAMLISLGVLFWAITDQMPIGG